MSSPRGEAPHLYAAEPTIFQSSGYRQLLAEHDRLMDELVEAALPLLPNSGNLPFFPFRRVVRSVTAVYEAPSSPEPELEEAETEDTTYFSEEGAAESTAADLDFDLGAAIADMLGDMDRVSLRKDDAEEPDADEDEGVELTPDPDPTEGPVDTPELRTRAYLTQDRGPIGDRFLPWRRKKVGYGVVTLSLDEVEIIPGQPPVTVPGSRFDAVVVRPDGSNIIAGGRPIWHPAPEFEFIRSAIATISKVEDEHSLRQIQDMPAADVNKNLTARYTVVRERTIPNAPPATL